MSNWLTTELKTFSNCGENVLIDKSVQIINPQNISIGNNVRIDAFCFLSGGNGITIGNNVHIAHYTQLSASGGTITINDFCGISSRVSLFTASDDYSEGWLTNPTIPDEFRNIKIGNIILQKHVIIGCGSILMPNVTIHEGASVGALSFVNKSVPEYTIVSGQPLQKIGKRNKSQLLIMEKRFYERVK